MPTEILIDSTKATMFLMMRSTLFVLIFPLFVRGFAPPISGIRTNPSVRHAFLAEHSDLLTSSLHQWDHVLHQSQILLADATGAISEEKQPGFFGSLWKQYLSIFEGVLTGVHSTIDEPLRSIGITQTWGISIFLFTAGMRSLLIPLSIQQNKSAEYQKLLKPYIKEIRQKFKDNDQLRNRALGKLYEDSQQSPFNGCLLSLAQLPILLGLYRGIRLLAKDNLLKEPFLWIPSLEGPTSPPEFRDMDWLTTGWHNIDGIPTPLLGWETTLAFLIMPIVLVLGQSLTLRVLTPQMDTDEMSEEERDTFEKSQLVFKFLPLMLGYFSLQVPAGLTIYWFTSNVFTLSQSLAIRAYYKANPPKIELPEYWDSLNDIENMSAEERRAATEAGLNVAPTLTSLREESMFHYVVQRKPLRQESSAWARVEASGKLDVPPVLQEWVQADTAPKSKAVPVANATAASS